MSEVFVDQGEYLSLELLGAEHINQTISNYGDSLHYDGLLVGLVIENISSSTCYWNDDAIEIVDANGFAYSTKYSDEYHHMEELLPGGWYAYLDKLQPNRKYRYAMYIEDFHGEMGLISFEEDIGGLTQSTDPDAYEKKEQMEIDVSSTPSHDVDGVPELREIFDNK